MKPTLTTITRLFGRSADNRGYFGGMKCTLRWFRFRGFSLTYNDSLTIASEYKYSNN